MPGQSTKCQIGAVMALWSDLNQSSVSMLMPCYIGNSLQVLYRKPSFKSSVMVPRGPAAPWAAGTVAGPHGVGQGRF